MLLNRSLSKSFCSWFLRSANREARRNVVRRRNYGFPARDDKTIKACLSPWHRCNRQQSRPQTKRTSASSIIGMYRKIRLGILVVVFLLCLIFDSGTEAQLNFSTGWGKRSQRRGSLDSTTGSVECGSRFTPTLEQLLNVYRTIQMEAQQMLDCRKLNE